MAQCLLPASTGETERECDAPLITIAGDTSGFDGERAGESARRLIEETGFNDSYLAGIQVRNVDPSMQFDVVAIKQFDANITVVIAVRNGSPSGEDRVITTLLLRVPLSGNEVPEQVAVVLDIGDFRETVTGI